MNYREFITIHILFDEIQRFYDRGDIPISVDFDGATRKVVWRDIQSVDYHIYLPMLFEGIKELEEPYQFIAEQVCSFYGFVNSFTSFLSLFIKINK